MSALETKLRIPRPHTALKTGVRDKVRICGQNQHTFFILEYFPSPNTMYLDSPVACIFIIWSLKLIFLKIALFRDHAGRLHAKIRW